MRLTPFFKTNRIKIACNAVVLVFSIILTSCTMMLLKATGNIKNPKLETGESIRAYCLKNNDPYDILWMPDTNEHLEKILNRYPGVPSVLIYDKEYNVLQNAHGEKCQKMLIEFFSDSLKHHYIKVNDSSYTL